MTFESSLTARICAAPPGTLQRAAPPSRSRALLTTAAPAALIAWLGLAVCLSAQSGRDAFVSVHGPDVALTHVDVIDGTGGPVKRDQTVVISGNRISGVGPAGAVRVPSNSAVIELRGHTLIPGLVGMHDHLFCAADGGTAQC
jgi:hypothetical protein